MYLWIITASSSYLTFEINLLARQVLSFPVRVKEKDEPD